MKMKDKLKTINKMNEEMWEVEDEYLDTWLMMGPPDGATNGDLIEYMKTPGTYEEWVSLFDKLIKEREEDEEEY